MSKIRILTAVFLLIACGLAYFLAMKINEPIKRQKEIAEVEAKVVEKLIMIREAQKEYIKSTGVYADKWKDLIAFVDTGISYDITKEEHCEPRPIELRYLGDTCTITYDTLGSQRVKEKLFPASQFPDFKAKDLPYVPGKDYKFVLEALTKDMGGVDIQVVRVMDPKPEDKTRTPDHQFNNKKNLYFGSKDKATLEGNWAPEAEQNWLERTKAAKKTK